MASKREVLYWLQKKYQKHLLKDPTWCIRKTLLVLYCVLDMRLSDFDAVQ